MKQTLSIITLAVEDLQRSLNFYRDGLGWTPNFATNGVAFLQMNGVVFSLFLKSSLEEDFGGNIQTGGKSIALAHNVSSREDVDSTLQHIDSLEGGTVIYSPKERVWGGYSGYFEDPLMDIFGKSAGTLIGHFLLKGLSLWANRNTYKLELVNIR